MIQTIDKAMKVSFFLITTLIMIGCGRDATIQTPPTSSASTVDVALPDRKADKMKELLTGVHLKINPTEASCQGTTFEKIQKWSEPKFAIKVKKACAHKIQINLGKFKEGKLEAVYFSNAKNIGQISKDELAIANPKFAAKLEITAAGIAAGFTGDSVDNGDADVDVQIQLPDQVKAFPDPMKTSLPEIPKLCNDVNGATMSLKDAFQKGIILAHDQMKVYTTNYTCDDDVDTVFASFVEKDEVVDPDTWAQCRKLGSELFIDQYIAAVRTACQ